MEGICRSFFDTPSPPSELPSSGAGLLIKTLSWYYSLIVTHPRIGPRRRQEPATGAKLMGRADVTLVLLCRAEWGSGKYSHGPVGSLSRYHGKPSLYHRILQSRCADIESKCTNSPYIPNNYITFNRCTCSKEGLTCMP